MANVIFIAVVLFFIFTKYTPKSPVAGNDADNQTTVGDISGENGQNNDSTFMEKPVLLNGDFEQGGLGWGNPYAIQEEENGNHYIINNYSWQIKQDMTLLPHTTYEISACTKKGTAEGPARIVFTFLNAKDERLPQHYDIKYVHKGAGWEQIPYQYITVPENAALTRIYLLTKDEKGFHCFDNIQITRTGDIGDRKHLNENKDEQELMVNGDFELGLYGWIGMASLIKEEDNNKFIRNSYNWEAFQQLEVTPVQKYLVSAKTRAMDSKKPARIKIVFLDQEGQRIPEFYNILHTNTTGGWESVQKVIEVPAGIHQARIYLLTHDPNGNGTADFDEISFKPVSEEELNNISTLDNDATRMVHDFQKDHIKYTVKPGDTASAIAQQFGIPVEDLIDENNIIDPDKLEVDQILYIPQK